MDRDRHVDEFKAAVRAHLDRLTERLTAELSAVIDAPQPPGTALLDFEAHPDELASRFSVLLFPMDRSPSQLGSPIYLLTDVRPPVPKDLFDTLGASFEDVDPYAIAFRVLVDWFASCWNKAGGDRCRFPAFLCQHDDIESYDLRRGVWVDDEEKWSG